MMPRLNNLPLLQVNVAGVNSLIREVLVYLHFLFNETLAIILQIKFF